MGHLKATTIMSHLEIHAMDGIFGNGMGGELDG